jgi:hypothetical protein
MEKKLIRVLFSYPLARESNFSRKLPKIIKDGKIDEENPNANEHVPPISDNLIKEGEFSYDDQTIEDVPEEFRYCFRDLPIRCKWPSLNEFPIDKIMLYHIDLCHHPRAPCSPEYIRSEIIILTFDKYNRYNIINSNNNIFNKTTNLWNAVKAISEDQINERIVFDKNKLGEDITNVFICLRIKEGLPKFLKYAKVVLKDAETNTIINQWKLGK